MKLGDIDIAAVHYGGRPIVAAYIGDIQVWPINDALLHGQLDAVSALGAAFSVSPGFSVQMNSISVLSAELSRLRGLAGSMNAVSDASAQINRLRQIAGSLDAISQTIGDLAITHDVLMAGVMDIISAINAANATVQRAIAGAMAIVTTLQGSVSIAREMTAALASVSAASGPIQVAKAIAGTTNAISGSASALTVSGILATDFSEYTTGAAPSDWTEQYNVSGFSTSVEAVAGSISGKALRWTKTAASRQGFSWNKVPSIADVEILLRARSIEAGWSDGQNIIAAYVRGSGGIGSENGYRATASGITTSTLWTLGNSLYSAGTATSPGGGAVAGPTPNYTVNTWFYLRFRMVGTSFRARMWHSGVAEPGAWGFDFTDATLASAGWTGMQQVSTNPNVEIDYFAASINNAGSPATIPVPV